MVGREVKDRNQVPCLGYKARAQAAHLWALGVVLAIALRQWSEETLEEGERASQPRFWLVNCMELLRQTEQSVFCLFVCFCFLFCLFNKGASVPFHYALVAKYQPCSDVGKASVHGNLRKNFVKPISSFLVLPPFSCVVLSPTLDGDFLEHLTWEADRREVFLNLVLKAQNSALGTEACCLN